MTANTRFIKAIEILCLGLFISACADDDSGYRSELASRVFISQNIVENSEPYFLVDGTNLRLVFRDQGQVTASAGCNSMSGTYQISDGIFVVKNQGTTEMGCDLELHAQDDWFFGFLGSKPLVSLDGDSLTLTNGTLEMHFLDEEVATPDLELVGPEWIVDTIIDGEAAVNEDWSSPATLQFSAEKSLSFFTGCNDGEASFEITGEKIILSSVISTDMECADEQADRLEQAIFAVLGAEEPISWSIQVDRLSLNIEGAGLGLKGKIDFVSPID